MLKYVFELPWLTYLPYFEKRMSKYYSYFMLEFRWKPCNPLPALLLPHFLQTTILESSISNYQTVICFVSFSQVDTWKWQPLCTAHMSCLCWDIMGGMLFIILKMLQTFESFFFFTCKLVLWQNNCKFDANVQLWQQTVAEVDPLVIFFTRSLSLMNK